MLNNDKYTVKQLDWDTDYFGIKCCKVVLNSIINDDDLENIINYVRDYNFITIVNSNNLNENNFIISKINGYLTDVNVQFEKDVNCKTQVDNNVVIKEKCEENIQMLEIAKTAYSHSRFLNERNIDKQKAKLIYFNWLKNSFDKEGKFIAYFVEKDSYIGYCLFHFENEEKCIIELIATSCDSKGKGIGSKILNSVNNFCVERGIHTINVGTQLENVVAQNFYIKNGFKIKNYSPTYHIWRKT